MPQSMDTHSMHGDFFFFGGGRGFEIFHLFSFFPTIRLNLMTGVKDIAGPYQLFGLYPSTTFFYYPCGTKCVLPDGFLSPGIFKGSSGDVSFIEREEIVVRVFYVV